MHIHFKLLIVQLYYLLCQSYAMYEQIDNWMCILSISIADKFNLEIEIVHVHLKNTF